VEPKHTARCVNCRAEIVVPATYAHGDHIKCGGCGMKHKVARGDVLRLVLADVTPLKEAVQANRDRIARLDDELRGARRSLGLGVNGLGVGVIYALWQITQHEAALGSDLIRNAALIALASGVILELANYLFLAKRHRITRITQEIEALDGEVRQLEQRVREASRM
jgi:hypothetical protein